MLGQAGWQSGWSKIGLRVGQPWVKPVDRLTPAVAAFLLDPGTAGVVALGVPGQQAGDRLAVAGKAPAAAVTSEIAVIDQEQAGRIGLPLDGQPTVVGDRDRQAITGFL